MPRPLSDAERRLVAHAQPMVGRLAARIARRFPSVEPSDLESAGNEALVVCVLRYRESEGDFEAFAFLRVQGAMLDAGRKALKHFTRELQDIDELVVVGYGFADAHINNRIMNAMVLRPAMRVSVVDPGLRKYPEFLEQFDYDSRLHRAYSGVAQWMTYAETGEWDTEQIQTLKKHAALRLALKMSVEATFLR